ncbi:MAG: hypothetical protein RMM53_01530, partial [Bacteroidia bacterium]|nr:hypothetical protein [Bacteroidia bacterium]
MNSRPPHEQTSKKTPFVFPGRVQIQSSPIHSEFDFTATKYKLFNRQNMSEKTLRQLQAEVDEWIKTI